MQAGWETGPSGEGTKCCYCSRPGEDDGTGPEPWSWGWRAMDMLQVCLKSRLDGTWSLGDKLGLEYKGVGGAKGNHTQASRLDT